MRGIFLAGILALLPGCGLVHTAPLETVETVDVQRYVGKWYEIASIPNWFQRECVASTAEYDLLPDGRISVFNACREGSLEGPVRTIEGNARVVDAATNAKLAVSFFGPFEGAYWIIELDPDYQWAVVGEPSRSFLWILSRTPTLDPAVYDDIISRLPEKGYDPSRLQLTPQAP